MNLHLEEIGSQVTPGSHAVLLLDGAGWHQTGGKLRVPKNISLLHPPPYSPELNPVENIWQFLRQNTTSATVSSRVTPPSSTHAVPHGMPSLPNRATSPPSVRSTRGGFS